jgi:hypothetical protein
LVEIRLHSTVEPIIEIICVVLLLTLELITVSATGMNEGWLEK